jgi:hypothetical protein
MIDYKKLNSLPAALRNKVIYEEKLITKKEMIDDVILVKKLIDVKQLDSYKQKPYVIYDHSGHRFTFVSKAEKKYIDYLIKKINEGGQTELEHKATIKKIQTELPSTNKAAKYIAADHIEEDTDYYKKLLGAKLEHGGSVKIGVDEMFEKTKQYLDTKKDLFYTIGANSKTDFGQSRYIYVFEKGGDSFENKKIRISDHSVTNINRLMDEYHIFDENEIKDKVDLIEYYFFPEKFTKQEVFNDNIVSMEIPASQKKETDIVVSERLSSAKRGAGRLIYSIKRNNPQKTIKIINPNRNDAVIGSYRPHLERGGKVQSLKDGTVLKGPSHDNGGIEIVVNNKPVAEAEGGEVVINAENSKEYCHELSEINQRDGNGKPLDCGCAGEQTDKMEHGGMLNTEDETTAIKVTNIESKRIFYVLAIKTAYGYIAKKASGNPWSVNQSYGKKAFKTIGEIVLKLKQEYGMAEIDADYFNNLNKMEHGGEIKLNNVDLEFDEMARGGLINKRMKFPKNAKAQDGKYGSIKSEPQKSDYQKNKEIEQLIDQKGDDPNNYLFSEKQFLREYSGYGGIDVEEFGSIEEAKKALTEFYTPDAIIRKMWALAYKFGFKDGQSVLEPSVGTGEFLKYVPTQSMATGYEINKYSYTICKILYPQFNFYLQPFENIFIKNRDTVKNKLSDIQKFDLVIGNPPYGDVSGLGMGMGEKQYTNAKNWIEYFILRGLDLTLPNGLLIYIIGTEVANGGTPFLQQSNSKIKQMIADKADLVDAYRLPNGVFDRTDVLSDILVFKRK